jgi:biopolymer transport protein ExbD
MSRIVFRERKPRPQVDLNVTSLVDVLFLLLIFFTLTSTFKRAGELELKLPESTTAGPGGAEGKTKAVQLVLTEHGTLLLNGAATTFEQLPAKLREVHERQPDSQVMIEAEEKVEHGRIVRLLDAVRTAGFTGVGIGVRTAGQAGAAGRTR